MTARLRSIAVLCLSLALLLAPWVGVGLSEWLWGRSFGMGIQMSVLASWGALACTVFGVGARRSCSEVFAAPWLLTLVLVVMLTSTESWRLDSMGLAGELPWLKSLKQLAVLLAFVGCLLAPLLLAPRAAEWRRLERFLALGLLGASLYGLLQALNFQLSLPGMATLERWSSSNPSVATGSHELYLGHRFVGIPRVRAGACEPLYFGSYLLAAIPCVFLTALHRQGFSRHWRLLGVLLATLCLLLSFSRGVYVASFVVLICLALGARRHGLWAPLRARATARRIALALLGLAVGLALFTGLAPWEVPGLLVDRLRQSFVAQDMSNLTRLYAWRAAVRMWLEQPWLGVGWGAYGFHYYRLAEAGGAAAHFGWPMANNLPLLLLAETGLLGLAIWTRVHWPIARALFRPPSARSFLFATLCVGCFVQFLTHSQLQLPHIWLLAGFALSSAQERTSVV